ncbi:MAG: hypothetical protein ACFFB5_11715 [Promethearchaeota archaeon]
MTNIRGIKTKKTVGIAILATLMIGIMVGIAIDYLLLSNEASFNITLQTGLPLNCQFTKEPSGNIYVDQWYNQSIEVTVTNNDDYQGYNILYHINITASGITSGNIEMLARVKGQITGVWSSNYTLSFSTIDTDIIHATFLASETLIAKSGENDDVLIAQIFFRILSGAPTGQWDVDLWIEGYPE